MSTAAEYDRFQFVYVNWKAETGLLGKYLCVIANPHKAVVRKQIS